MSDFDVDAVAARHQTDGFGECEACEQSWPCDAAEAVAEVRKLREELADAQADAEFWEGQS